MREDSLIDNVVPAVQDYHRRNIRSGVAVVEDYELDATVQGTNDPSADVLSVISSLYFYFYYNMWCAPGVYSSASGNSRYYCNDVV